MSLAAEILRKSVFGNGTTLPGFLDGIWQQAAPWTGLHQLALPGGRLALDQLIP